MHIQSTTAKKSFSQPIVVTPNVPKSEQAGSGVERVEDGVSISLQLPQNYVERGIAGGVGAIAGGFGMALLGGGSSLAATVAATAVGGAAGLALSSDTAKGVYGTVRDFNAKRREKARLQRETAAKAEELFQAKVDEQATSRVEQRWAQEGEALVSDRVASRLAARVEAEAAPRVERQVEAKVAERVEIEVAKGVTAREGEIENLVEARVASQVTQKVEELAAPRIEAEVTANLDKAVSEGVSLQMKDRSASIEEKIQAKVEQHIAAEAKERLAARQESASWVQDLKIHSQLGLKAGQESFKSGLKVREDGFDILLKTREDIAPADKRAMEVALTDFEKAGSSDESLYYTLKALAQLLQKSTGAEPASLDPKAWLNATKMANGTWNSRNRLMGIGLEVLSESEDLSPTQKLLCEKALASADMGFQAKHAHRKNVLKLLAGEKIA